MTTRSTPSASAAAEAATSSASAAADTGTRSPSAASGAATASAAGDVTAPTAAGSPPPVRIRGLRCRYGDVEAVAGVDLDVGHGEVVALLGSNGAGKTTTLSHLLGEQRPQAGTVRVLGVDPRTGRGEIAPRTGVVFQHAGLPEALTVREAVVLWARLHGGRRLGPGEVDATLDEVGLTARAERAVGVLSGGERRRLELAIALSGDPELLVLDEPTTGMDPTARRQAWELIRAVRAAGRSVLLTTHDLHEAAALADRIAVMHRGHLVAEGTEADLVAAHPSSISVRLATTHDAAQLRARAGLDHALTAPADQRGATTLRLSTDDPQRDLTRLLVAAEELELRLEHLRATPASLDTAFHALTADQEDPR